MGDEERALGGDPRTPAHPRGDRDIRLDRIFIFIGGLVLLLAGCALVCWLLYATFRRELVRKDPPPSPLPEANAPVIPPEPRLQENPVKDMEALREHEEAILESYGWVDRDAGIARIPIERAMDLMLDRGLRPTRAEADAGDSGPDGGAP